MAAESNEKRIKENKEERAKVSDLTGSIFKYQTGMVSFGVSRKDYSSRGFLHSVDRSRSRNFSQPGIPRTKGLRCVFFS